MLQSVCKALSELQAQEDKPKKDVSLLKYFLCKYRENLRVIPPVSLSTSTKIPSNITEFSDDKKESADATGQTKQKYCIQELLQIFFVNA